MSAHLVSDIHLDRSRPRLTEIFIEFLRGLARTRSRLFLLGDIFEVWVGDDDDEPLFLEVGEELLSTSRAGVHIDFMHGNRDFLVGQAFSERFGVHLIDDPIVLPLGGRPTLLTHGDRYCTSEVEYQAFRAISREPSWQRHLLEQPLSDRRALAQRMRAESMSTQKQALEEGRALADVDDDAVIADLVRFNVSRVIHGHTHKPATHHLELPDGTKAERIVLADWRTRGEALAVEADGRVHRIPLTLR